MKTLQERLKERVLVVPWGDLYREAADRIDTLETQLAAYKQAHDDQITLVNQIATERNALRANNRELLDHRFVLMGQVATRNTALKECAEKFSYYEQHHVDKGDKTKAQINRDMAVMCWSAIAAEKTSI